MTLRGAASTALFLLVALAGAPGLLLAQEEVVSPPQAWAGLGLLYAQPTGEFADNVDDGFGVEIWGRLPFDPADRLSLRADVGFLNYGNETIRICITQPCRIEGDLTTSNNIFFGGIGPELGIGTGWVRVYGNASIGFAYFATTSSVEGSDDDGDPFASDTNFDDLTFAWTAGGGAQLRLAGGLTPVYLDVGGRYHGNGEAEYLRKGDIEDLPDGGVRIKPRHSDTNLWTIRLGVSIGFGATVQE